MLHLADTNVVAMHTALSVEMFAVFLMPGCYTVTVERGKKYQPLRREVEVGQEPLELKFPLRH